jgi:hypothetical protein
MMSAVLFVVSLFAVVPWMFVLLVGPCESASRHWED